MENYSYQNQEKFNFEPTSNPDEARDIIAEMLEKGFKPIVTIPKEYADSLRHGLKAHTTWIPNFNVIAGTLGREPYQAQDRIVVQIDQIPHTSVHPRFTGPDKTFQGVVIIDGPISPEQITIQ